MGVEKILVIERNETRGETRFERRVCQRRMCHSRARWGSIDNAIDRAKTARALSHVAAIGTLPRRRKLCNLPANIQARGERRSFPLFYETLFPRIPNYSRARARARVIP
jgi:hypothetical protein